MTYYDAEIEYLESTGTELINIDIILNDYNNTIETKITHLGYLGNLAYSSWFSSYTDENSNAYRIIRNNTSNTSILVYNGRKAGGGGTTFSINVGNTYNIKLYPTYGTINNTNIAYSSSKGNQNKNSLKLFNHTKERIYYFKIIKEDTVILDLIPVRIGSVGYMYDKVSDTLFGNSGTGSFILGPDVAGWPGVTGKPKVSSIRRQMIQLMPKHDYKQNDYIQDGLVFWLDGINKGSNEGAWTDLMGGHIYTNYGATALENGWRLYKKYLRSADCNFLPANSNQTVEIVFKPTVNSGPQAIWMQNGSGNMTTNTVLLFWNGTAATFLQHNKTYTIPLTVNAYHCVSLNLTLGLVNGVKKDPNTNNDYWNNTSDYSAIGCRNSGAAYFNGDIFAIRVYDRRLTEDEMLHNQQVDNIRFNLGLDLT